MNMLTMIGIAKHKYADIPTPTINIYSLNHKLNGELLILSCFHLKAIIYF